MNEYPDIPDGTTHIWTPAYFNPILLGGTHRRSKYKLKDYEWYSYSDVHERWLPSSNPSSWFEEESSLGYFVPLSKFQSVGFIPVPEKV